MRKLIVIGLLLTIGLFGQDSKQKILYDAEPSTTGADAFITETWSAKTIFGDEGGDFKGRFDLSINVTNTGLQSANDYIYVLPYYHVGHNWIEGDTITWNANTQDDVFVTTKMKLQPQGDDSLIVYLYKMDPAENSVTGMGWDEMYWKVVSMNAASCAVKLWLLPY